MGCLGLGPMVSCHEIKEGRGAGETHMRELRESRALLQQVLIGAVPTRRRQQNPRPTQSTAETVHIAGGLAQSKDTISVGPRPDNESIYSTTTTTTNDNDRCVEHPARSRVVPCKQQSARIGAVLLFQNQL
jgi:hypothetical protein